MSRRTGTCPPIRWTRASASPNERSFQREGCLWHIPQSHPTTEYTPPLHVLARPVTDQAYRPIGFPIGGAQSIAGQRGQPVAAPRQPSIQSSKCRPPIRRHAPPVFPNWSGLAALPDSSIGAGGASSPGRLRSLKRVISSLLSSSPRAPAPPVCARTTRHCLAADFARQMPASTWSTLPLYGV